MEFDNAAFLAFLNAGIISTILTGVFIAKSRRFRIHPTFTLAAAMQSMWMFCYASYGNSAIEDISLLSTAEAFHYIAWILAIVRAMTYYSNQALPRTFLVLFGVISVAFIAVNLATALYPEQNVVDPVEFFIWQGIVLSILSLFSVEQLYRNSRNVRLIKLVCLNLAIVFSFDMFYFTQRLNSPVLLDALSQVRAIVVLVSSAFIALNIIIFTHRNEEEQADLSLSRPIIFYTTSLTIAAILLAIVILGGFYIRSSGGDWGEVIYSILLVASIVSIVLVFASSTMREKLSVHINKHFFSHKYDYRSEWLKLIEQLAKPNEAGMDEVYRRSVSIVADIFRSSSGILWMKQGNFYVPVYQEHSGVAENEASVSATSEFCRILHDEEWVFFPTSESDEDSLKKYNEHLPSWTEKISDLWLVMPLICESDLTGFMALTRTQSNARLNWEDLDLLKTVGRQMASYLKLHAQADMLAESRQFDTFNKLSAYVMHDLKNIIAQQSLVVANAEKHKDNPAFIDDALRTVENSVQRMNTLLRKLQRNEPEAVSTLKLTDAVVEAVQRRKNDKPVPSLRYAEEEMRINADWDSLVMVFIHIIQNAQDATDANGFVDVTLSRDKGAAQICIEDNGVGMDEQFIRERLFKPFDTTKSGKGMGIGVYQAQDYIRGLGGAISVESKVGEGTSFHISLPLLDEANVSAEQTDKDENTVNEQSERQKEVIDHRG